MPEITITYPSVQTLVVTVPNVQTVITREYRTLTLFDRGQAPYSGINKQYVYSGEPGQTTMTIENISVARDLIIQQGLYILYEHKGAGSPGVYEFKRSGNTLTFGKPLTNNERVLIITSTALTIE